MGSQSDIKYTVTKATKLADITTSIHDSDGSYANVDKTSAVIYKVQKLKKSPIDGLELHSAIRISFIPIPSLEAYNDP